MSSSDLFSRRYMKAFVYWPIAIHPEPRSALLISYGVGSTARALTDTRELETIDVVDVSRDILEMSRLVFPEPGTYPLDDPRVSDLLANGFGLLEHGSGLLELAQVRVSDAEAAEVVAFALPVADLAGDDQTLLPDIQPTAAGGRLMITPMPRS